MAFEDLKDNIAGAEETIKSYAGYSADYYQLKAFKIIMLGVTSFARTLLVGVIVTVAVLFLSLAASFGLGQVFENTFFGFLAVGLFYVLLAGLIYALRRKLDHPLLRKFSEFYFDET